MQITLCATTAEYAEIDMGNHGQVIDWLVRQPFSSDENLHLVGHGSKKEMMLFVVTRDRTPHSIA